MLSTVALQHEIPTGALDQIRRLSRPFSILFSGLLLSMATIWLVMFTATLFYDGPHVRLSNDFTLLMFTAELTEKVLDSTIALSDIPIKSRLVGIFTLGILQWGSLMIIFFQFRELFRLYGDGLVFEHANIVCIRRIGIWLMIWGIAPTIGHQVATLFSVHDEGWFRFSSVAAIIFGGILQVMARVMKLGREMQLEQARFI
jgi:hypothetical protein